MKYLITIFCCLIVSVTVLNGQKSSLPGGTSLNKSNSADSTEVISKVLLNEISNTSFKLLNLLNLYKEIIITSENPFKVNLLYAIDGPLNLSGNYNGLSFKGQINLSWLLTFGIIGDVKTSYGTLSNVKSSTGGNYKELLTDGDPFEFLEKNKKMRLDYNQSQAFIDKGDITIEGQFNVAGAVVYFENGSVTFSSGASSGEYSNGTILVYKGLRYRYFMKNWQRL
jgi:hypothetical protein